MTPRTPADVFAALWDLPRPVLRDRYKKRFGQECRGSPVVYADEIEEEGGYYDETKEFIALCPVRVPFPDPTHEPDLKSDPLGDACVLAHEYGHLISEISGLRTAAWRKANELLGTTKTLKRLQRELVLAEEQRAWNIARGVLASLGVEDFAGFREVERLSLESYEKAVSRYHPARSSRR